MDETGDISRYVEFAETWRMRDLDPREDEVQWPGEEVKDMLVSSLLITDAEQRFTVLKSCVLHADLLPVNLQQEVVQFHVELDLDVVEI